MQLFMCLNVNDDIFTIVLGTHKTCKAHKILPLNNLS